MKIKALPIIPLLLSASFAAPAQDVVDNDFNIYVGGAYFNFDGDKDLDNDVGWFFGGEFPILDRYSLSLEHYEGDTDHDIFAGDVESERERIGLNYHLNPSNGWQPYIGLGLGTHRLSADTVGNYLDETTYDLSVGLKRHFAERFIIKGDARALHGRQTSDWDYIVGISVGLTFGGGGGGTPTPAAPRDSDGDGVPDDRDNCPGTPPGTPVDANGCPEEQDRDSDGDGVPDSRDNCPNTPRELAVDENGCPILDTSMLRQEILVEFAFDSDEILPRYEDEVREFAEFMRQYSNTEVTIEGHTDATGPEAYNQGLSERRAQAVRDALVENYGIDASRLSVVGYGESRPVASNDTREGRERNRRIVAEVSVEVQEERRR